MQVIVSVCVFCVKPLLLYDTWVVNGKGGGEAKDGVEMLHEK